MISKDAIQSYVGAGRSIVKAEGFIYLLPHPALRNWISNYTISFPDRCSISERYSVIPHGCATLVLSCDECNCYGYLFGPTTKPAYVGREANRFRVLFIVEFQPAGYYAFSGMPQRELLNSVVPFDIVNPVLNRLMAQQIETDGDLQTIIMGIDRLFLAHLKAGYFRDEFSLANNMIVDSGGQISVKELS